MERDAGGMPAAAELAEHHSIITSSHDAIIGMTQSGIISSCNLAAARLYGYVPDEIVGKFADVLIPPNRREEEGAILRRIVAGEEVESYRADRICRDGTAVTVSLTISPIVNAAGAIVGAATVARRASDQRAVRDHFEARMDQQRTEVRDAEDRFQGDMDAERARERVQVQDAQDRFQREMDAERARERVHVQDAQDRFQARMDAERAKDRAQVKDAGVRFQAEMDAERAKERMQVRDAEERFQFGVDAERAKDRAQVKEGQDRFQVELDVERAEAQSEKDHLELQLQQAQRLEVLGQLAGGVAHDFNNLLAVILSYATFVTEELTAGPRCDWEAARRDVRHIQRTAERAAALTHQLLAFARREVVKPRVLDLNHIVANVDQLLRRTIGEDVVLRTELADGLWPVLIDAGQIEQVLVNLAVNARDAMSRGGTLTIDTANVVVDDDPTTAGTPIQPGRHVRLRVRDTGTGMPVDVIAHAFEPFFTTKPAGAGTGLGLATAYGIVVQAEGTIDIRSAAGVGTTFTIMIPVTGEHPEAVEEATPYHHTPTGETVLVVEDEEALRDLTGRIFSRSGYLVITAADGNEAVALATRHEGEIQLLVTDVVLPHMLGKEVAERIRQIEPGIEVLYMSGYPQAVLAAQGRLDPGVNLVEKPFSAASLIETAARVLTARRNEPRPARPPHGGDAVEEGGLRGG